MNDQNGLDNNQNSSTVYSSGNTPPEPAQAPIQQPYAAPAAAAPSTNVVIQAPSANPAPQMQANYQIPSRPTPNTLNLGGAMATLGDKIEQIVMLAYFFIAAILLFRFVFSLFGASRTTAFSAFVYSVTDPFMLPFKNLFGFQAGVGQYRLEFEAVVALVVYGLAFFGIARIVKILFK